MKKLKLSRNQKLLVYGIFMFLFIGLNIVYAATSAELHFCEYSGVLRSLKIVGIIILIAKILIPIILIITAMISFFKTVISGKSDDLKGSLMIVVKKIIAGLIIFILPGLIDYVFDVTVGYDDSGFTACTTCLLDIDNCQIPTTDPTIYTD